MAAHQLATAKSRLAAGVVQQHHRQQPVDLGLVRRHFDERPAYQMSVLVTRLREVRNPVEPATRVMSPEPSSL